MSLNAGNLLYIVQEIKEKALGSYLGKFVEYSKTDFFFSLSKNKTQRVIISLQSSHPFISLTEFKDPSSTLASPFFLSLRKELDHAYVENLELWNNDRIVVWTLQCTNDVYETNRRYLVIELITGNANMLLLDKDRRILLVYRHGDLESKRPLLKGLTYTCPEKNVQWKENIDPIAFDYLSLFDDYRKSIEDKRKKDKFNAILSLIKSHKKSALKKWQRQNQELLMSQKKDMWKEYGDLLITYLDEVHPEQNEFRIFDYVIPLDADKSAKDNALLYYKKYQKARNAEEHLTRQMAETKAEIDYFSILESQWEGASERDLQEMEEELVNNGYLKKASKKKFPHHPAIQPYFCYFQGVKIGYGKNNLQNDTLTFHLARKNDIFLHVQNHQGAHVVIFDSNPNKEVLIYAASLALKLAHLSDGDVIYTPINQVKKTSKSGLVQLNHYQTLHLNKIDDSLFTFLLQ